MKKYLSILIVLLMFRCGGQALKQPRGESLINSPVLTQIDLVIPQKPPVWPDSVTKLKYGKIIDKIRTKCDSYIEVDSLPDFVNQIPRMGNTDFTVEMSIQLVKVLTM